MVYVDTSAIVKLYIKEDYSQETSDWIKANNQAIPKTFLHELEFSNAIKLKQFRNEMTLSDSKIILERFDKHEKIGIFYSPQVRWPEVFSRSLELAKLHTEQIGSRSLDILHVALALLIQTDQFFTFDERQSQLAEAAGLKIIALDNSSCTK